MAKQIVRQQHVIDAAGQPLGRLATEVATLLRGKHKPSFQPHLDEGDAVVIQNVDQVKLTGNKEEQKIYYRNTGYPGGIRSIKAKTLRQKNPAKMMQEAVRGMLPDNKLRARMLKRLTIQ